MKPSSGDRETHIPESHGEVGVGTVDALEGLYPDFLEKGAAKVGKNKKRKGRNAGIRNRFGKDL